MEHEEDLKLVDLGDAASETRENGNGAPDNELEPSLTGL